MTIVLFKVLGAFANRPFDPSLEDDERDITVADVRSLLCVCCEENHLLLKHSFPPKEKCSCIL